MKEVEGISKLDIVGHMMVGIQKRLIVRFVRLSVIE